MYKVYGMADSGNCYKVKFLLEHLQLPYQWEEVDILKGATRTPEFLALNPNAKVPVLEIPGGQHLAESNAILTYLAEDTALWPSTSLARAQVLQWLFFEQYSHEPYIAVARYICKFLPAEHARRAELPTLHARGLLALAVMEQHLAKHAYFVSKQFTIADIGLFAYTHVADQGGFDLQTFPAIRAWIERIKAQERFIPIG